MAHGSPSSSRTRRNAATSAGTQVAKHAPVDAGPTPGTPAEIAIPALIDRAGGRLHGLARRLCGNAADADDMVQEVFLQAFRKWHTFRGDADPTTWLYAIAARACKARHRRKGGSDARAPAMSQLMPWSESTVTQLAAAPDDTAETAARNEAVSRVQREIARLPEHLRLPLVLKEVLELSVEDTASALGLAENTVKTRLHRARLALRKAMTAKSPGVHAPAPIFEKQVCLDLLKAKLDAMDRGGSARGFTVPQADVCARCRAVFRELDLVQDACSQLGDGAIPKALKTKILRALADRDAVERIQAHKPRRGRRPVTARPHP
jgi:RNA polymerase sigma-70 factor (ECF subfamily)